MLCVSNSDLPLGGALHALRFQCAQRGSLSEFVLSDSLLVVQHVRAIDVSYLVDRNGRHIGVK